MRARSPCTSFGLQLRGAVNGLANARVCSAAAEIAAHGGIDVFVSRLRTAAEQCRGRHDLAGLAVTALWHVGLFPCFEHGMSFVLGEAFDGEDLLVGDAADMGHAGSDRAAINQDGASSADTNTASVLCAFQIEEIAKNPEQGRIGRRVDGAGAMVHMKRDGHGETPQPRGVAGMESRAFGWGNRVITITFDRTQNEIRARQLETVAPNHCSNLGPFLVPHRGEGLAYGI